MFNFSIEYEDFIWGDKFSNLNGCFFSKIDDVVILLKKDFLNKIVTHNGDISVDESYLKFKNKFNYWFGQNIKVVDEKFIPIPIGLENDYVANSILKKNMLNDLSKICVSTKKLLYINHNIGTNPKERQLPYNIFSSNNSITVEHCSGFDSQLNFYKKIMEHDFVLSPPGNGLDCHRTWEILYLKRIPILRNLYSLKKLYSDLPVLFIERYDEITEDFLLENRNIIKSKSFNFEKLKFSYWKNFIESK